jgi:hypothetical protein
MNTQWHIRTTYTCESPPLQIAMRKLHTQEFPTLPYIHNISLTLKDGRAQIPPDLKIPHVMKNILTPIIHLQKSNTNLLPHCPHYYLRCMQFHRMSWQASPISEITSNETKTQLHCNIWSQHRQWGIIGALTFTFIPLPVELIWTEGIIHPIQHTKKHWPSIRLLQIHSYVRNELED